MSAWGAPPQQRGGPGSAPAPPRLGPGSRGRGQGALGRAGGSLAGGRCGRCQGRVTTAEVPGAGPVPPGAAEPLLLGRCPRCGELVTGWNCWAGLGFPGREAEAGP